jgi:hypothetical protein
MKKLILTIMLAFVSTIAFAQIPVTFQVDMGVQVFKGNFTPGTDMVVVRGSFQEDAGDPGGNWQGSVFELTDTDGDTIYTVDANLPADSAGKDYFFKFVINTEGWESTPDRMFTLTGPTQTLPVVFFNDDDDYTLITNTITFEADLSQILFVGAGNAFDPAQDSIVVMGLDWSGGQGVTGNRTMEQDLIQPNIFRATLTVQKTNDSTSWKFKAFPDDRFSGGGWETGSDRWYTYGPTGTNTTVGPIVPRIFPLFAPLTQDVDVRFQVDMRNAVNRYNQMPIDPNELAFVGLRGGTDWLGSWVSGGNWLPSDTSTGNMKVLNDDGVNGDETADDDIWTITILVPAGTDAGAFEYKFAAMYPGADTVNGGSSPLDNEGGFGMNHLVILVDGPDIEHFLRFGNFTTTSVDRIDDLIPDNYTLSQNYPNPFNPSTKITFSITNTEHVVLKIFNVLGQQVDVLLDNEFEFGTYEVEFDASRLSSGIYFYTLEAGNFTATKKMMLMK